MSSSIAYITSKANFTQVSPDVPITKQRNPEKVDPPDVFEGAAISRSMVTLADVCLVREQEGASNGSNGKSKTD